VNIRACIPQLAPFALLEEKNYEAVNSASASFAKALHLFALQP